MSKPEWEDFASGTARIKVDGGYLYGCGYGICFVPDVDLTRYQSHLRDAYNQGFKDGQESTKHES